MMRSPALKRGSENLRVEWRLWTSSSPTTRPCYRGGHHDEKRIYGFTSIPKIGWRVYVGIPTSFAFASARVNTLRASLAGGSLLCVVIAAVVFSVGS